MRNLPRPRIETVSSAVAGGFLPLYHQEVPASLWNVVTVSSWNSDTFQFLLIVSPECALQAFILHHCPLPPAPASAHPLSPGRSLSHSGALPTSMHCFCWAFSLAPLLSHHQQALGFASTHLHLSPSAGVWGCPSVAGARHPLGLGTRPDTDPFVDSK